VSLDPRPLPFGCRGGNLAAGAVFNVGLKLASSAATRKERIKPDDLKAPGPHASLKPAQRLRLEGTVEASRRVAWCRSMSRAADLDSPPSRLLS